MNGSIPEELYGDPWFEDGNILIVADQHVFRYPRYLLILRAPVISEILNLEHLSDDFVDLVDGCPVVELPDHWRDLSSFLSALHDEDEIPMSLDSMESFHMLSGVLRLATKYKVPVLRQHALRTIERGYPSTLLAWDELHRMPDPRAWRPPGTLIVNLATETKTFSFVPAAMVEMVSKVVSSGNVFGVTLHYLGLPQVQPKGGGDEAVPLQSKHAERGFAALKEHDHVSIINLLNFVRTIGEDCTRPPDVTPSLAGRAPVGARVLKPQSSACHGTFREIVRGLLERVVLGSPLSYNSFVRVVSEVRQERKKMCQKCWRQFSSGRLKMKEEWWSAVPKVLGFDGWNDPRLARMPVKDEN